MMGMNDDMMVKWCLMGHVSPLVSDFGLLLPRETFSVSLSGSLSGSLSLAVYMPHFVCLRCVCLGYRIPSPIQKCRVVRFCVLACRDTHIEDTRSEA